MGGIEFTVTGDFKNLERFLKKSSDGSIWSRLEKYGQQGVSALSKATPKDTNKTAQSWGYRVIRDKKNPGIEWYNTNVEDGVVVAVIIQYGHGTGTGGYVQGRDYINPAMQPIFDALAEEIWKEVRS